MPNQLATAQIVTTQLAIADWVQNLAAIPEREFTLGNVHNYFLNHHIQPETLAKYSYFSKGNYTRNLIFKNELFECMTVCWEIGQASRIHNHRDQNCWMTVPIGRLHVQNYRVEHRDATRSTCDLIPTDVIEMNAANPAYVNPREPVHEVINRVEYAQRAVSVHVYSRPFDMCEIYQREKGTYADAPLFYTSEYGQLHPDAKLL
ncbi:MAG TPA: cysteine dioxygenase family protein [Candidatus Acidoferrum sp.]|nr:cysteine dioxygenase family protein [Candidatus Acidoferrum sp.]